MRIAVGGIFHETNTYADESSGRTGLDAFVVRRGAAIVQKGRGTGSVLAGILDACDGAGHEVVPLLWALAWPSGTITADAYATLRGDLLEALRAALPVDAVALELHGAGVVEGVGDLEGDLGSAIREIVGPDVPVVAAFDLHGNATDAMVEAFDGGLYACHLYPHTDLPDRGREIVGVAERLVARIDVREYDVVGLKSSQHFRSGFGELAGAIVTSDAPGLTTTRTEVFDRRHAPGPLWPKDADAAWP